MVSYIYQEHVSASFGRVNLIFDQNQHSQIQCLFNTCFFANLNLGFSIDYQNNLSRLVLIFIRK